MTEVGSNKVVSVQRPVRNYRDCCGRSGLQRSLALFVDIERLMILSALVAKQSIHVEDGLDDSEKLRVMLRDWIWQKFIEETVKEIKTPIVN